MNNFCKYTLFGILFSFLNTTHSQSLKSSFWSENAQGPTLLKGKEVIKADVFRTVRIDLTELKKRLINAPHRNQKNGGNNLVIELPHPDGSSALYEVFENNTMHPDLKVKFP